MSVLGRGKEICCWDDFRLSTLSQFDPGLVGFPAGDRRYIARGGEDKTLPSRDTRAMILEGRSILAGHPEA
jgi:hypothetical protein